MSKGHSPRRVECQPPRHPEAVASAAPKCGVCGLIVDDVRSHLLRSHLPWWTVPGLGLACWSCSTVPQSWTVLHADHIHRGHQGCGDEQLSQWADMSVQLLDRCANALMIGFKGLLDLVVKEKPYSAPLQILGDKVG